MSKEKSLPMFVVDQSSTIKWPVVVSIPVDGGEVGEFQFTGIFKRVSDAEFDEIVGVDKETLKAAEQITTTAVDLGELVAGELLSKSRAQVLRENSDLFPKLLTGWEGVRTSGGGQVGFSEACLRDQILGANGVFLSIGLWRAISEIRNGTARLGN